MLSAKNVETSEVLVRPKLVKTDARAPASLSGLLKNGLLAVTPELALRLILECGYERQRSVRPLHTSALAKQMIRKEWTPGTQLHFARMAADDWFRVIDGQHRLHAVIESSTTVEFQILVTDCANEADVVRLYRRHDRLAVRRTVEDVLRSEGLPEKYGITNYFSRGVFNAALIIAAGFAFSHRSPKADPYLYRSDEARLRLCEQWWSLAERYAEAVSGGERRIKKTLSSGPVMAVALITLRDNEAKADAFWRGLANNDGLRKDDPRSTYIRFLNVGIKGRHGGFYAAKAASLAWNAFFSERRPEYIRVVDTPIRILGSDLE